MYDARDVKGTGPCDHGRNAMLVSSSDVIACLDLRADHIQDLVRHRAYASLLRWTGKGFSMHREIVGRWKRTSGACGLPQRPAIVSFCHQWLKGSSSFVRVVSDYRAILRLRRVQARKMFPPSSQSHPPWESDASRRVKSKRGTASISIYANRPFWQVVTKGRTPTE